MKKLCTIIMLGLSVWVYGQKVSDKETDLKKEHEESMHRLLSFEEKKIKNIIPNSVAQASQQFLLEDSLVTFFSDKENLFSVYKELYKDKEKKVIFATGEDSRFKIVKQDSVNNYEYYETNCEVYTIVKKDSVTSNAKFDVTLEWKGKNKKKDKITLEKICVKSKEYTANELSKAKAKVKEWYAGLDKNLKEEYRNKSVLPSTAMSIKEQDIKLQWDNQARKFVTTEVPQIKITTPWEISPEDSIYYEPNPVAYYNLTPKFTISMIPNWTKKTLTAVIDTVIYGKGNIVPPVKKVVNEVQTLTEIDGKQRHASALSIAQKFRSELSGYANHPSEKNKKKLESLFLDKNTDIVEVSYLTNSQEKINSRIAEKYFSRLKPSRMVVELSEGQLQSDANMETIVIPFKQTYEGPGYSDYTMKKLHLKYVDGSYFIEKVTVVPNSTRLKE